MIMKRKLILYLVTFLLVLLVWQISIPLFNINRTLFPLPIDVILSFQSANKLFIDTLSSLTRLFIGSVIGILSGIVFGLVTGKVDNFNETGGNVANFFRFIPPLALVPLFLVWFGITEISKILLLAWTIFFPVWISTHNGVRNIEKKYLLIAKSLGLRSYFMLKEVILKGSMPYILNGSRIGVGIGFSVLVAAEMLGSFSGLGYRILFLHSVYRIDLMVGYIIILGILGLVFDRIFLLLGKRFVVWKNES